MSAAADRRDTSLKRLLWHTYIFFWILTIPLFRGGNKLFLLLRLQNGRWDSKASIVSNWRSKPGCSSAIRLFAIRRNILFLILLCRCSTWFKICVTLHISQIDLDYPQQTAHLTLAYCWLKCTPPQGHGCLQDIWRAGLCLAGDWVGNIWVILSLLHNRIITDKTGITGLVWPFIVSVEWQKMVTKNNMLYWI